ncbi:hypothetical protein AMTR_s00069p00178930 [Amborella trichopoda]|uniref:Peptidase S8/S53 domain-containing protein n=1 Tax=Amborella trichopoda TaxID=13333 RepID=U5DB38_AMBTC|nr:hypothetical protein AMTR_s00069p00178930 [Amborella trichopoda]
MVASFSSRGPSFTSPGILKPDIIRPGESILAGWPSNISPTIDLEDQRTVVFNILSGTSMSAPHPSGVAALLKSAHPMWSLAAMMTTADTLNNEGTPTTDQTQNPADVFETGASHMNPTNAADPGRLVYDLSADDYIPYLCGLGHTEDHIQVITRSHVHCSNKTSISEGELNYPSFTVILTSSGPSTITLKRTVTNVGVANSRVWSTKRGGPEGEAQETSF